MGLVAMASGVCKSDPQGLNGWRMSPLKLLAGTVYPHISPVQGTGVMEHEQVR
jgi:hypothetical protein